MRILVVDDYPQFASSLQTLLSACHEVTVALGGAEAIAALQGDASYDALLVDINMPKVDGWAVCAWLERERPALLHRTVLMTGGPANPSRSRGWPVHWIEKPFKTPELLTLLGALVPQRSAS